MRELLETVTNGLRVECRAASAKESRAKRDEGRHGEVHLHTKMNFPTNALAPATETSSVRASLIHIRLRSLHHGDGRH